MGAIACLRCPISGWECRRIASSPCPFESQGEVTSPRIAWPVGRPLSPPQLLRSPSWLLPAPILPVSCVGCSLDQGWVSAAQLCFLFLLPLLLVALEVYREGVGMPGGLALNFSCVCACVSFPAPGLTLRVWRVVMMVHLTSSGPGAGPLRTCSHPAPCQPPSPTASLALRASLCSGTCTQSAAYLSPQPPGLLG